MKTEKKIFVESTDSAESVIDRVRNAQEDHVIVNVARSSLFGSSVEQFQILLQEAFQAQKELTIESIDDHVLELASLAGAKAVNPIFMTRARAVTDIVPRLKKRKTKDATLNKKSNEEKRIYSNETSALKREKLSSSKSEHNMLPRRKDLSKKTIVITTSVIIVLIAIFFVCTKILPRATITLTLIKTPIIIDQPIVIKSDALTVEASENGSLIVPGELLLATRNIEIPLATNGVEESGGKAIGQLIVYNSYNTQPQVLVATTRFESPEGKIFRLNKRTTIPGGTMSGGVLKPGSIEISVTADEAGGSFNIGASKDWRIPGFAGTARYEKFYADAPKPMTGGFSGTRKVPTEGDIVAGEKEVEKILRESLEGELLVFSDDRFKILEGASKFLLVRKDVQARSDPNQGFGMFGEAELRRIIFDESMLRTGVVEKAVKAFDSSLVVKDSSLSYGSVVADFENGTLSFVVTGSVILQPPIALDSALDRFAGADEGVLRLQAMAIEGLDHVDVDLWPFWVSKVPINKAKIKIVVE